MRNFLRRWGLRSRYPTVDEVDTAIVDDALHENTKAFEKLHDAYSKVPLTDQLLKEKISKAVSPFADLEDLMKKG